MLKQTSKGEAHGGRMKKKKEGSKANEATPCDKPS